MAEIQVISSTLVQARTNKNGDLIPKVDLTTWDLQLLQVETIQKGLLFHNPTSNKSSCIQHLKDSLSSTLDFFYPLAGRFNILERDNNQTISISISCNNAGALFVHAIAKSVTISDILQPIYIPPIVHSMFPQKGVKNSEGGSKPLLAVQVTELVDGIFIGCSMNHSVGDGTSFWHFFNSWAEISRGGMHKVSKLPSLDRWFPEGIEPPIFFPFAKENDGLTLVPPPERVFHFTKEKIASLKTKANQEANTNKISSLQALLTHVWLSTIRNKHLDPNEDVSFVLLVGVRKRIFHPPLPESYFGNAVHIARMTKKAGELLEGGIGNAALEMNQMISLQTEEKLKGYYEYWVENPHFFRFGGLSSNTIGTSSSPRFDIYGNDFGWGKPVAVRSGAANKAEGKLTVFAGAEEGSIDMEFCSGFEILEALGNDPDFLEFASI